MLLLGDINFCENSANIWQIVGYALLAFKIVIPILLIIFGMLDLGKAVVASKDDEIKKATKQLAIRAVAGIVIFFIPTLVGMILGLVSNFAESGAKEDFDNCRLCITKPGDSECAQMAEDAWNGNIEDPSTD